MDSNNLLGPGLSVLLRQLFYKHSDGKISILIVYVDDIILTRNNSEELSELKKVLAREFEIKDLG